MSRFTSSLTCQPILVIIATLSIHHSFTLSLQVQNLPLQQILPTLTVLRARHWLRLSHRQIVVKFFCMLEIIINIKFLQNQLNYFRVVGNQNLPFSTCWPLAYMTACTIVHDVMLSVVKYLWYCSIDKPL